MKRVFTISVLALLLNSCTLLFPAILTGPPVVTTHEDYMSKFSTKRDVVGSFGVPTKKQNAEGLEIWYFDLGSSSSSRTNVGIYNNNNNAYGNTTTNTYDKYVEFQFNEGSDYVVRWRSKGVDYGKKEYKKGYWGAFWTGYVVDLTAICVGLVALVSY